MTSYHLKRLPPDKLGMDAEEWHSYQRSLHNLQKEGYNPGKAFREDTVIWSYNCQMANHTRIREWSAELKHQMILLQGTQQTYDPTLGEKTLTRWQTDYHDVIEARVQKKARQGHQPEGVTIMVPKGMFKIAKKVVVPTAKELEGRGLMIWFSRGLYDLVLTTMYCPLCDRDVQNHRRTEKLWQWAGRSRQLIPGRARHILGTDANGK